MTAFSHDDLLSWSERLPGWQRDALRRVLEESSPGPEVVAQLADLAVAAARGDTDLARRPASAADVTPSGADQPSVALRAVENIQHVNALAPGPVAFSATGLTVIYGENAAGKSGIVRILKKACRSRDPGGAIRPNVFAQPPAAPPAAAIHYTWGDDERATQWTEQNGSISDLRVVTVFDAACATIQITQANQISYVPDILNAFRALADCCDDVSAELQRRKLDLGSRPAVLDQLELGDETEAGRFLARLGPDSSADELHRLATVEDDGTGRFEELTRALADDPLSRAAVFDTRAQLIGEVQELVDAVRGTLSKECIEEYDRLEHEARAATEAADAAREAFDGTSDLSGLGSDAWRDLWEAARHYSEARAYPAESFPFVRDGAVCVLCQQEIGRDAQARLTSFEAFVQAETQQRADKAREALDTCRSRIAAVSFPRSVTELLRRTGLEEETYRAARRFLVLGKLRRRQVVRRIERTVEFGPCPDLGEDQARAAAEAGRFRSASRDEERVAMARERAELGARIALATHRDQVEGEIERLREVRVLDTAIQTCQTRTITLKAREVAQIVVTDRLRSGLARNLSEMGFSATPVDIRIGAGEHGRHPYEIRLMANADVPPDEVLSEGERTCAALAGFLAELETSGNQSSIVLDDPVSSLDHVYRKRVAERLVREARGRQVIVFTHDVVFLFLLRKYGRELAIPVHEGSVVRGYRGGHGQAEDGPPWIAMPVNRRLGRLRAELQNARTLLNSGDRAGFEQKASWIYEHLRQTWERAVEEVLLYETVLRFGDSVQTQRLARLTDISDEDVRLVTKEMSRCSDFVHDEAGAAASGIPEPDAIASDILTLEDWVTDLRKNRRRG